MPIRLKAEKPKGYDYPEDPRRLGEHLKKVRLDRGLLQREVAKQIGVSADTVLGWEQGKCQPSLRLLSRIRAFLGFWPGERPQTLGERLLRHRRREGLTQRELAEVLDVDPGTLSRWERGLRQPAEIYKERIHQIL